MRDGTPPQYRERFSAGQPERDSNRVLGLGAGFGLTPLSPGGRGVGGEGDVLALHHSYLPVPRLVRKSCLSSSTT